MNRYVLTTYEHPEMNWLVLAESKESAIETATTIHPQWEWTTTEDLLSGVSSVRRGNTELLLSLLLSSGVHRSK